MASNPLPPFQPFPEWKQLKANIWPLLATKKQFTYDELKELAGVDIQSPHGRQQFLIFRRHALKEWNIWFECVYKVGYDVIPAGQHAKAAVKRVRQARRRIGLAQSIQHHAKYEEMTPAERLLNAQVGALVDSLAHTFHRTGRELSQVAQKFRAIDISEDVVKDLGDAPAKNTAPAGSKLKGIDMSEDAVKSLTAKKQG